MALIAALDGSRRHSSPAPAPYRAALQIHGTRSLKSRKAEFQRARRRSASVGLRRKGSRSAITSHKNLCRAGVRDESW